MMGVVELAAATVTLVGPYLAKGAEELAKKVGEEVGARVVKLWDALKAKLRSAARQGCGRSRVEAGGRAASSGDRGGAGEGARGRPGLSGGAGPKLIEAIPEQDRAAIQQIANVTGDQNVTVQIAGAGNRINIGRP